MCECMHVKGVGSGYIRLNLYLSGAGLEPELNDCYFSKFQYH